MAMKILTGPHMTATERRGIKAMIDQNFTQGTIGRTRYTVSHNGAGHYVASATKAERGIGYGSPLRNTTSTWTCTL